MIRSILAIAVFAVFLTSCDKEAPVLTKAQIRYKVDSITAARIKEVDQRAQRDLEYRMKIELKGKVDSILNAKRAAQDTANKPPVVTK